MGPGTAVRWRRRVSRWRRTALAALICGAVVLPSPVPRAPRSPAPAPAALAAPTAGTLEEAYAANRANAAEASRMAAAHGDRHRAAANGSMADPSRRLLAFDGRGAGLATEVFGDLAHADRVAVLVPGSDTSLDTYGRFRAAALALHRRLAAQAPEGALPGRTPAAVVAWLGYETPGTVSTTVATTGRADRAAPEAACPGRHPARGHRPRRPPRPPLPLLRLGGLRPRRRRPGRRRHRPGRQPRHRRRLRRGPAHERQGLGGPGRRRLGAARAAPQRRPLRLHRRLRHRPGLPGLRRPVFAAGDGGHSDYFKTGSVSLTNLARIALGEITEVTHD